MWHANWRAARPSRLYTKITMLLLLPNVCHDWWSNVTFIYDVDSAPKSILQDYIWLLS